MSEAAKSSSSGTGKNPWVEGKSKLLLVHSSSGHKHALQEVLSDPAIQRQLSDTKYSKEIKALEEFFTQLNNDPDRAFYGFKHVQKAADMGAISALLLSDDLFR
jgi:protein pelota